MTLTLSCIKCGNPLPTEFLNTGGLTSCPQCGVNQQLEVFPAFFKTPEPSPAGERILVEGESSCFYHPQKKAVVPCEECGRFLCALCDVELEGRHLCPACLESGKKKKTIRNLEDERFLYNRQALLLSIVPFFITGMGAIYMAWRYWKAPVSLVHPMRWAMPVALVFGILQTVAFAVLIFAAVHS